MYEALYTRGLYDIYRYLTDIEFSTAHKAIELNLT